MHPTGPSFLLKRLSLAALAAAACLPSPSRAEEAAPPADKVAALAALPLDTLLDMEVTGASRFAQRRSQSASSVTVITAAEIRAFGWRTLADALTSVKGLQVANDHTYSYLGVRGFFAQGDYNSRVLLLIDGNRINENVYDMAFLGTDFPLDLELVDRIEFIPGQGSAIYGPNALFAVVNVITREAERDGLEASLSTGTGHHHIVRLGGTKRLHNGASIFVSASRTHARGPEVYLAEYDTPPASDGKARDNTYERRESLYLRAEHGPWRASLVHADRTKGVSTYIDFAFNDPRSYYRDVETLLDLGWEREIADETRAQVRWFIGRYTFDGVYALAATPILNAEQATGQWWGFDARLLATRWSGHMVVAGVEFQKAPRQNIKSFDLDPAQTTYWDVQTNSTRTSLYAEDQASLSEALTLTLGARYDHFSNGPGAWNPRLALNWKPTQQLVAKLIHGSAYRLPNRSDLVYSDGGLRSETVKGNEVAVEWQPDSRRRFSFSWFHNSARYLVAGSIDPTTLLWVNRNVGRLTATGQELEYEQRFASGALLRANATFQHARDTGELPIAQYAARRIANVLFALPAGGRWTLGMDMNAATRRGQAAGYGVFNLTLSQRIEAAGPSFAVGIRDVFDRKPDDPGSDPVLQPRIAQTGRAWTARLDVRF
jgi:outer membrane receptor protein involved in Fe transport